MNWTEQMLAVGLVAVLLAGTLLWLRRKGFAGAAANLLGVRRPRRLEMLDRLSLTPQHSLHLVRLGNRTLLLGRSPSGLALLDTAEGRSDNPEEAAR
ncbi:MAG: flagellar biosynthetic protein FliO [Bryobacterales bacterium]|nr:flagellar biosynthetic protein FliO [Bryobacterales bacterium]